jgi:SAM-dependent methyltransferase
VDQSVHKALAAVEEGHWLWRARREIIAALIDRYAPRKLDGGLRLAEVGCGSGGNLATLARFGSVLGAEADPDTYRSLREARGEAYPVVLHHIPEPLPGRYHVLGMFDVLEHIADDANALSWAADHLEPDGILVLTVPAFQFLWSELDDVAHHFRRYTPGALRKVVPPTLTIEHMSCFNSFLFPLVVGARTAMRLLPHAWRPGRAQLGIPPAPINWLLHRILRLERHLVVRGRLPLGVSILLVARRRSAQA